MINTNFLTNSTTRRISDQLGKFSVIEYTQDMSVNPVTAVNAYFLSKMNVRKKQLAISLNEDNAVIQAGAMQWMAGSIAADTNVKGAGDFAKKLLGSKVTNESTIKPRYSGNGLLVLEPTYKYILLEDLSNWEEGMVIEDGCFFACDGTVNINTIARSTLSSAVLGREGLFNTMLSGHGIVALESDVPKEEIVVVNLVNDIVKIDGNYAIAWSKNLQFTVERTTKTLIGSAVSGEGLVNVYRGTGKILLAPIQSNCISHPTAE